MNDWCGHCGQQLEDTNTSAHVKGGFFVDVKECVEHDIPEFTVDEVDAWRIREEAKHGYRG